MDSICIKAGVNKGSLYYHVISKEIFAVEVIRNYQKNIAKSLTTMPQSDPVSSLKQFQHSFGHGSAPSEKFSLLAVLIPEWNSLPTGIHIALGQLYRFKYEWIRKIVIEGQLNGIFREDISADIFADIILCHAVGGQAIRRVRDDLEGVFAFTESLFRLLSIPSL